ncbi:MAG TPA: type II toxin-antitoxin system prevent-host-death family antitoxin, partial [Anaerolineae bacterium]|nr:type II toxin-antitoxin system prevent-host-death family antitoxin [Anaerolineae bacterium]
MSKEWRVTATEAKNRFGQVIRLAQRTGQPVLVESRGFGEAQNPAGIRVPIADGLIESTGPLHAPGDEQHRMAQVTGQSSHQSRASRPQEAQRGQATPGLQVLPQCPV